MLVALFAMVGLILSMFEWEHNFNGRGDYGLDIPPDDYFTELIVLVISGMGFIAIVFKYYFEAIWQ